MGNVTIKSNEAREALLTCQRQIDSHPDDPSLQLQEKSLLKNFHDAARFEEETWKQKSRIQWLNAGDQNTSFFFNMVNSNRNRNKIIKLSREDGSIAKTNHDIETEAINYYKKFLGSETHFTYPGSRELKKVISKVVPSHLADNLDMNVSIEEIKETLFSLHKNKAPGPDGYNAYFFKQTWHITGGSVTVAI